MFSKYNFWVKTTSVSQILTASIHSISLFTDMKVMKRKKSVLPRIGIKVIADYISKK